MAATATMISVVLDVGFLAGGRGADGVEGAGCGVGGGAGAGQSLTQFPVFSEPSQTPSPQVMVLTVRVDWLFAWPEESK